MMQRDPRLKYILTYYKKDTDELAGEVEIGSVSDAELRTLLKAEIDDLRLGVFPVPQTSVALLVTSSGHTPDTESFDYFFEVVVRSEFVATYYAAETPPYPAPESLPAFSDAMIVRPQKR